ncbi:hypothetical protein [Lyngbya aestuarii]|uniref:hypothetical protein n=1 Tax=Lyngbya aestuarii TaxID=118322 RepID=UPI00403D66CF
MPRDIYSSGVAAMHFNFEPPPKKLSILVCVGGLATAALAIAGLEYWSNHLARTTALPKSKISTTQTITSKPEAESKTTAKTLQQEAYFQRLAKLDGQSVQLPGLRVTQQELQASKTPYLPSKATKLTTAELAVARQAWQYFRPLAKVQ